MHTYQIENAGLSHALRTTLAEIEPLRDRYLAYHLGPDTFQEYMLERSADALGQQLDPASQAEVDTALELEHAARVERIATLRIAMGEGERVAYDAAKREAHELRPRSRAAGQAGVVLSQFRDDLYDAFDETPNGLGIAEPADFTAERLRLTIRAERAHELTTASMGRIAVGARVTYMPGSDIAVVTTGFELSTTRRMEPTLYMDTPAEDALLGELEAHDPDELEKLHEWVDGIIGPDPEDTEVQEYTLDAALRLIHASVLPALREYPPAPGE